MTISTMAFGAYFYMVSVYDSSHATAQPDLSWLPLASMAVYIAGI